MSKAWLLGVVAAPVLLAGCVAAVPPQPLVVLPGQQKTAAQFQGDDAACRGGAAPALAPANTAPQTGSVQPPANQPLADPSGAGYYQCMASRGNSVLPGAQSYPYPYPYAAYAYGGGYPVYPGGYYGGFYGYPYSPAFLGVYGIGLGLGYGGFYGGYYRGGYGGFHGGYGGYGGFRGGYGGGGYRGGGGGRR